MTDGMLQMLKAFDFCIAYFVIQLGRCALISFFILGTVLLVRVFILKDKVFAKGMAWGIFLVVPFLGKLKAFYEDTIVTLPFLYWQGLCIKYMWVRYGYLLGMIVSAIWLYCKQRKSTKAIKDLKADLGVDGTVYISELPVSPFSIGLFKPKIIIPDIMRKEFGETELHTIILHEKTHIQLGHIWIFMFWKILAVLLWINPFLIRSMSKLKEDMEVICDRVTIGRSGMNATGYGKLVIKSMALLKADMNDAVTFTGEKDFVSAKERIKHIRDYEPCKTGRIVATIICGIVIVVSLVFLTAKISFPRYTELTDVTIMDENNQVVAQGKEDLFENVFVFEKNKVEVNNKAFCDTVGSNDIEQKIYYVYWGGYMKIPGIGGATNCISIEDLDKGDKTYIPYKNAGDGFIMKLIKWL